MRLPQVARTIPTLWSTVQEFLVTHPLYVPQGTGLPALVVRNQQDNPPIFTGCHFWSK